MSDTERLNWILRHVEDFGTNGLRDIPWTPLYGADEVEGVLLDREAIDKARQQSPESLQAWMAESAKLHAADETFDLEAHLRRQRAFSERTFGPGARTAGVCDHIRKELAEIEADPADLREWVDVIILAFDGAWRAGWEPAAIIAAIVEKQTRNEGRTWPDWRAADPTKAIEHVRTEGGPA